jgi:putative methionine-R-sulfoxide reductase with GAF domain
MNMHSTKTLALTPLLLMAMVLTMLTCLGAGYAMGATGVYANLEQTHNSLLEQRDHLQRLQGQYSDQIAKLQQQLNLVGSYLSDNDRALRDIEEAMRNAR